MKSLDLAKDCLGLAGTVAMAMPWFRDYKARVEFGWLRKLPLGGGLARVRDDLVARRAVVQEQPSKLHLHAMWIGLLLLGVSFLIAVYQDIAGV